MYLKLFAGLKKNNMLNFFTKNQKSGTSDIQPLVLANWKMNLSVEASLNLARALVKNVNSAKAEIVLCPSFPALSGVSQILKHGPVKLGAQDVFWKDSGAYTGEVSPQVLGELGVQYVLVGHSERRQYLGETDVMVNEKVRAALLHELTPVLCVGETFTERQQGLKDHVIARQVAVGVKGLSLGLSHRLVVAYEPIWAIGTGQAVEPADALHASQVIRQSLIDTLEDNVSDTQVAVIYGGSVDSSNVHSFIEQKLINGVLVGGASLGVEVFSSLIQKL